MKKFLISILLFFLPVTFFIVISEIRLSKVPNTYEYKRKSFEIQLQNIETIILGNSQAFGGVNPEYLSYYSFNLCNNSQTLYYDTEITLKYLKDMSNL